MGKLPAIQFYPGDWLRDDISGCSLAAQGLWLRMMFLAHDCDRYGYLATNGQPMHPDSIARRAGCSPEEYATLLAELDAAGVPGRTPGGIIFSRRMVRDGQKRRDNRKRQKEYREEIRQEAVDAPEHSCHRNITPSVTRMSEDEVEDEVSPDIPEGNSEDGQPDCAIQDCPALSEPIADRIEAVCAHYQMFHPRARAGDKERNLIRARLGEGYSVADLKQAIDGCHKSPWHSGENERGAKFQTLELIVRNASKVDQFIRLDTESDGPVLSEKNRRAMRAVQSVVEAQLEMEGFSNKYVNN